MLPEGPLSSQPVSGSGAPLDLQGPWGLNDHSRQRRNNNQLSVPFHTIQYDGVSSSHATFVYSFLSMRESKKFACPGPKGVESSGNNVHELSKHSPFLTIDLYLRSTVYHDLTATCRITDGRHHMERHQLPL